MNPPRMTPHSKHMSIKYHWFQSHLEKGKIKVKAIQGEHQLANILTKTFELG